jgi:hypothetical protein
MKDFTNQLVKLILENEKERLNNIMDEVMNNVSKDFAGEVFKLLDEYYDNYTPIRYVRVYGKKRKLRTRSGTTSQKPRPGQVSLHAAITRSGDENAVIGVVDGSYDDGGWIGGVAFDPSMFKGNDMRHLGKGISEWNIVENFLFAGEAGEHNLKGDWRSVSASGYNHHSADEAMNIFMDFYDSRFDEHYRNALKNN